jgi:hypothetical protein
MVAVLLGINALVYGGWWLAPPRFMKDHFVSSLRNLDEVCAMSLFLVVEV